MNFKVISPLSQNIFVLTEISTWGVPFPPNENDEVGGNGTVTLRGDLYKSRVNFCQVPLEIHNNILFYSFNCKTSVEEYNNGKYRHDWRTCADVHPLLLLI